MLQENTKNRMDTESKEHRSIWLNTAKGEYLAETDRQKTRTVWAHMQNAQQQEDKELMFGRIEDTNKRGRPHREWLDDIIKWGGMSLQKLSHMASDRGTWRKLMKLASDTYGR